MSIPNSSNSLIIIKKYCSTIAAYLYIYSYHIHCPLPDPFKDHCNSPEVDNSNVSQNGGKSSLFVQLDSKRQSSTPGGSLSIENQQCISEHLPFISYLTSVMYHEWLVQASLAFQVISGFHSGPVLM